MGRRFFSIGGMAPSGGESNQGGGRFARQNEHVDMDKVRARNPDFFKNRPEMSTAPFMEAGETTKLYGESAKVLHNERNADGSQETIVQKSAQGNSGTYVVKTEPGPDRTQQISKIKRSFD